MTDELAKAINNLANVLKWRKWADLQKEHSYHSVHDVLSTDEIRKRFEKETA